MKLLLGVLCLTLSALPAFAGTAFFTGRMHQVQTAKNEIAWDCQYNYQGKTFWRKHKGSCPSQVHA
jgi:hypothetical protein